MAQLDSADFDWVERFHAAALDPELWIPALSDLADATGSSRGQLIGIGDDRSVPFNWVTDFPYKALDQFEAMGGGSPAINYRVAAAIRAAPGQIVFERDYQAAIPTLATTNYLDFCRDWDLPYGCQTILSQSPSGMIGMALLRREKDGATSDEHRRIFAQAARAAASAVRLQIAVEEKGRELLAGALETINGACFLLDRSGRVVGWSGGAERMLTDGTGFRLDGTRLSLTEPEVARRLDRTVTAMLAGAADHARVRFTIAQSTVELFRLPARGGLISAEPRIAVIVHDSGQRLDAAMGRFAEAHGLTGAEAQVARLICDGVPRGVIAARRGVTEETLRAQLKAVYAKTGCRREAELVAAFLHFVG